MQEPLFYASQRDDNIAIALQPHGSTGKLSVSDHAVTRLVEIELQIEHLGAAAPAVLLAERDALLAEMSG